MRHCLRSSRPDSEARQRPGTSAPSGRVSPGREPGARASRSNANVGSDLYTVQMARASSSIDAWSRLVILVVMADGDTTTISEWAALSAISTTSLRQRCYVAGVGPRRSLRFARLLRAIRLSQGVPWVAADWLKVADIRTLRAILRWARLPLTSSSTPSLSAFLATQVLIESGPGLVAISRRLGIDRSDLQLALVN